MPLYEYECPKCHEKFELRRSFIEAHRPAKCPRCGSGEARKVFSAFAYNPAKSGGSCGPTASHFG